MQAIYTATSGMKSQQKRLDTIANNISNSNTSGYKSSRVDFKDALYTLMDSPVADSEEANLKLGSGVISAATTTDFTDGSRKVTGGLLDFAIEGNGFFTVQDETGKVYYTRNGNFNISGEGDNKYLVTSQGQFVLDDKGQKIHLPEDISDLSVSEEGVLGTGKGTIANLGIAEFKNPDGLLATGNTMYEASEVSGEAVKAEKSSVLQGSLENSNVSLADEMTLLIRAQRSYSLASTALRTADEMDGLSNNMR